VSTYVPEDLFAGKIHALLCRPYKVRVKGRDWYDFIWYVAHKFPLHLSHLESRMRQSGHYALERPLEKESLMELLIAKVDGLNVNAAKEDIRRFLRSPREIDGWSKEFFMSLLPSIQYAPMKSV
jgi:hypothetical protein